MEFTRKRLEEVKFKTKGNWYDAFQVDGFLDEMLVEFDRSARENGQLKEQLKRASNECERALEAAQKENEALREENGELRAEIEEWKRREAAQPAKPQKQEEPKPETVPAGQKVSSVSHQKRIVEELEQERDELIENIKMLRRFRDNFKNAIRGDAANFLKNLDEMESNGLL